MDIYTMGHSTHSKEKFLSILKKYKIEVLVDVRSYPGSKYVPHFNKEDMEQWLTDNDIKYLHMPELGGRRRKIKDIDETLINGWKNEAFRSYAAYSLTKEYEEGINKLIEIGDKKRTCYMCAESVPWRCHRLIISNTLVLKGICVYHIMSETKLIKHEISMYGAKAKIDGQKLIYPKQI